MSTKALPKPRLGRGLNSLIQVSETFIEREIQRPSAEDRSSIPATAPSIISVTQIHPNPHQPRRQFNETSLMELAASIKTTGLIQPIVVRPSAEGYELIAGERRWRAAQLAGLREIPALVREVDSFTQAQMALVENIQREDLNPLDRASAYQSLIDQLGLTQNELAARLGEDRSSIANFLRLLNLTESVRELIRAGRLSFGHAKLLAGIADPLDQQRLADVVVQRDLSVRNLEQLVRTGIPQTPRIALGAHIADLEKSIARQLGMRVQLRPGTKKGHGRLIVNYASLDQFDELLRRLGVTVSDE